MKKQELLASLGVKNVGLMVKGPTNTKGFIVCRINVGNLPPFKAEIFCERLKDNLLKGRPDGWTTIVMPVRPPMETYVEIWANNGEEVKKLKCFVNKNLMDTIKSEYELKLLALQRENEKLKDMLAANHLTGE